MKLLKLGAVLFSIALFATTSTLTSLAFTDAKNEKELSVKQIKATDGRIINVSFLNGTKNKITDQRLKELADKHKDADNIQIIEVGYTKPNGYIVSPDGNFKTQVIPTFTHPIIKKVLRKDVFAADKFMASCAKGQTLTIKKDITAKLSATADGNFMAKVGLKLNGDLSYTISEGTTLSGPPETSKYNCREFRCSFYQNEGTWERWGILGGIPYYFCGNFTEPSMYESYSIDKLKK